jgi:hypothetical protein
MSIIIHPRHIRPEGRSESPQGDSARVSFFWVVVGGAAVLLVLVVLVRLGLAPDPQGVAARPAPAEPVRGETRSEPVRASEGGGAASPVLSGGPSRSNDEPLRVDESRPQEAAIRDVQVARMRQEQNYNESLPAGERSPLAPTGDVIRSLQSSRASLQ